RSGWTPTSGWPTATGSRTSPGSPWSPRPARSSGHTTAGSRCPPWKLPSGSTRGDLQPGSLARDVAAHAHPRPPVQAYLGLPLPDRAQPGGDLGVVQDPEPEPGVVRRVPRHVLE